jgi:hypothetical protein
MEVSGESHASIALLPGTNLGADWVGGWVGREPVMKFWRKGKLFVPRGSQTPDRPPLGLLILKFLALHFAPHSYTEFKYITNKHLK